MVNRLQREFYNRDVLELAPDLLGKKIVRNIDGKLLHYYITEAEAYRGSEDLACHASRGKTKRTQAMFMEGGHVYMYFVYGMHWMFNIVSGREGNPQAVLIRSLFGIKGPGRTSRELRLDKGYYGESLVTSERIWLEQGIKIEVFRTGRRIGVNYAGDYWKNKEWRFYVMDEELSGRAG